MPEYYQVLRYSHRYHRYSGQRQQVQRYLPHLQHTTATAHTSAVTSASYATLYHPRPATVYRPLHTPRHRSRQGTVPVGAHPTAWGNGHWGRTCKGRTYRPSASYYHQHNEYYDKTSATTHEADAAWYVHRLSGTATDVEGTAAPGVQAPEVPPSGIHDTALDTPTPAAAQTSIEVPFAGTPPPTDAQASYSYNNRTPPVLPVTATTSTPMYVSLASQHVLRYDDHTVDNTVLAGTLQHRRAGTAPAPTGALRTTVPYLATRTPGTCVTGARANRYWPATRTYLQYYTS